VAVGEREVAETFSEPGVGEVGKSFSVLTFRMSDSGQKPRNCVTRFACVSSLTRNPVAMYMYMYI